MAKSNSFQSLGNGTYRVSGVQVSPTTGRYVTRSSAASHPRTTTSAPASNDSGAKSNQPPEK